MCREQPADAQVGGSARVFRDQGIGGFPHPIVNESVGAVLAFDELGGNGVGELRVKLVLGGPEDEAKPGELCVAAKAGELPQRLLRWRPQASQPADDELHHVVGVALCVNALRVP